MELERDAADGRTGDAHFADFDLWRGVFDQERISLVGLMSKSSAARLFPGELLVKEQRLKTCAGQPFRGEGARGAAAQHRDGCHRDWGVEPTGG